MKSDRSSSAAPLASELFAKKSKSNAISNVKNDSSSAFGAMLAKPAKNVERRSELKSNRGNEFSSNSKRDEQASETRNASERAAVSDKPTRSEISDKMSPARRRFEQKKAEKREARKASSEGSPENTGAQPQNQVSQNLNSEEMTEKTSNANGSGSEVESLGGSEAASKGAAVTTLSRLGKIFGKGVSAASRSEALALISGEFSGLNVKEVPALISQNPFVANALATEPGTYLNQSFTIKDIMDQLDVDEEVIKAADKFGVNLSEMVSPNNFFKAIGIDPHAVTAQITRIKNALPKAGVTGLMAEIRKAQGENTLSLDSKNHPGMQTAVDPSVQLARGKNPSTMPGLDSSNAKGVSEEMANEGVGIKRNAQNVDSSPQGMLATSIGSQALGQSAEGLNADPNSAGSLGRESVGLTLPSMQHSADSQLSASANSKSQLENLHGQVLKENQIAAKNQLHTVQSSVDPFERLGSELKHKQMIDFTKSPVQQNIDPDISALSELHRMNVSGKNLVTPLKISTAAEGRLSGTSSLRSSMDPASEAGDLSAGEGYYLSSEGMDYGVPGKSEGFGSALNSDKEGSFSSEGKSAEAPDFTDGELPSNRADGARSFDGDLLFEQASADRLRPVGIEKGAETPSSVEASRAGSISERVDVAQKILDRATLLVGRGGGSVSFRMDMGGNEVVDIAVKMTGNTLDLKLASDSKKTTERIASEVSGLEASLKRQNIQLGSVEVGQSGGENSSESRQDSRQEGNPFSGGQDQNQHTDPRRELMDLASQSVGDLSAGLEGSLEDVQGSAKEGLNRLVENIKNGTGRISVSV